MASSPAAPPASASKIAKPVTLIVQTQVLPERNDDFAELQQKFNDLMTRFPGCIDYQVIPPNPPTQVDWVILQKFSSLDQARAWLRSPDRLRLVADVQPMVAGHDDIHLVEDGLPETPRAVSAVISDRVVPGKEEDYRAWGQRIAAAEAQYPGFQGFKMNPPIPGIQDDWVTVVQFDSEEHLNAWLTSPERQRLLSEAHAFTTESHYRTVRFGFEQWFRMGGAAQPPAWKQNMLVLLALYPVVFLFAFFVQTPILQTRLGWPFWLALFAGNVAGVAILNWLVPWISRRFGWWLQPAGGETRKRNLLGVATVVVLYGLLLLAFSRFP